METKNSKEINTKEILLKLAKLQEDINSIKLHIKDELKSEMIEWEETSIKDTSNFFKKYNL